MSDRAGRGKEATRVRALEGLSAKGCLDAILAAAYAAAEEDGAGERVKRRGHARISIEVIVRDYEIVGVDVGSVASLRRGG